MRFAEFQPRLLFLFSMRRRNWLLLTKEFKKKEKKTSSSIRYWSGGKGIRSDERGLRQSLEAHNLLPLRFNSKDWNLCYILEKKKRPFNLWCPRLCMLIVTNIINRSIRNIQLVTNQPRKRTTIFVLSFQIRVIFFSSAWDQFSSERLFGVSYGVNFQPLR